LCTAQEQEVQVPDPEESAVSAVQAETTQVPSTSTLQLVPGATYKYNHYLEFRMFFTLDGPNGDGSIQELSQLRDFQAMNQNLSQFFVPDLATAQEVAQVNTRCHRIQQSSADSLESLTSLSASALTAASTAAPSPNTNTTNRNLQSNDAIDQDELENDIFGNTTYLLSYVMNYTSNTVNVDNYTDYYEITFWKQQPWITKSMRNLLQVPDTSVLQIKDLVPNEQQTTSVLTTTTTPTAATTAQAQTQIDNATTPSPTSLTMPASASPTAALKNTTAAPSMSFNSTSSGRYDFLFRVNNITNPQDELVADEFLFCSILTGLTPSIAPTDHNPEQVVTTCPTANKGWSPIERPLIPLETSMPIKNSTESPTVEDIQVDDMTDIDVEATATNNDANTRDSDSNSTVTNATKSRYLFLRGLQDQDDGALEDDEFQTQVPEENTTTVPPANTENTPKDVFWTYSITMQYTSAYWNVTDYPNLLYTLVNDNQDSFLEIVQDVYNLTNITLVSFRQVFERTPAPTLATNAPTTFEPTMIPTLSNAPSIAPTSMPSTKTPTSIIPPSPPADRTVLVSVTTAASIMATLAVLGLFILFTKRNAKLRRERLEMMMHTSMIPPTSTMDSDQKEYLSLSLSQQQQQKVEAAQNDTGVTFAASDSPDTAHNSRSSSSAIPSGESRDFSKSTNYQRPHKSTAAAAAAPHLGRLSEIEESRLRKEEDDEDDNYYRYNLENMPSTDNEDDDDDDVNTGQPLSVRDEFERFKDTNLEMMRTGVESSVAGLDSMMSQAMTFALMTDENQAPSWFGARTGIEIEANALWDVTEWLRRQNPASDSDKEEYMQQLLTKMVTSVRMGILGPEDASRTVHECAALLELELAEPLPVTTLILSGMQKTTTVGDVVDSFCRFGPIDETAVATNQRGFGILRFKTANAVTKTMQRFRSSEIVVKDVAITLKMLGPSVGRMIGRVTGDSA